MSGVLPPWSDDHMRNLYTGNSFNSGMGLQLLEMHGAKAEFSWCTPTRVKSNDAAVDAGQGTSHLSAREIVRIDRRIALKCLIFDKPCISLAVAVGPHP